MKRILVFLCCLAVICSESHAKGIGEQPKVKSQIRLLDEWIQTQMEYSGLPGLVIGIVHDQEVVWIKSYGQANLATQTKMRTDSIFRIASHSKLFTAIAVLQLRDQGRLRLDDPIQDHLPWFDIRNNHSESPRITIRHLLTHSSGLPRESIHPAWSDLEFPNASQVRATVAQQETIYPAESRWKYSNLGLTLAGMIVERVSGRPFEQYVEGEIIVPLKMTSSSVGIPPDEHRKQLATGYTRRLPDGSRKVRPFVDAKAFDPATGVSSNVVDMLRFLSWQMRVRERKSSEVLQPNTLREMQRVHWLKKNWTQGWGLGFEITHTKERNLIGHGGSFPGYRTKTVLSPEEKIGVVAFTNGGDGDAGRFVQKVFSWVAPSVREAAKEERKPPTPDPSWKTYLGKYRTLWGDSTVLILKDQLIVIYPQSENPLTAKGVLKPVGEHTFRLESEGFGPHGELVRFELDENGDVIRMFMGANYSERVR